ncbi:MAG: SDR family oxidoreductase [Burkholderiaceae bacterium]|nr:SDR family oxidoreductase [Burkholderiaceae bacterium]
MQLTLNGRTALITGGSLGLGLAMAHRFAEAGANLALVARRESVLADAARAISEMAPVKVVPIAADVSTREGCERAFESAVEALGKVDVLVNNAGASATGAFESITDEQWQADFELKLFAAVRLARLAFPGMKQRHWGRIINVLNTGAKAPMPNGAPTVVSRAAGLSLTKVLANEGAPHNVLCNALLVGRIASDQWVRKAEQSGQPLAAVHAALAAGVPMGRIGSAEEFANAACFLASDQGSYVTGTAINVDGGLCPVV